MIKISKRGDIEFRYILLLFIGLVTLLVILAFYGGLGEPTQKMMTDAFNLPLFG